MYWKCSTLLMVESRFFSSVMLMVFMVLTFRCCGGGWLGHSISGLCGRNLIHAHISPDAAICSLYRNVEEAWVSYHLVLVNLNHGSDWEHALDLFAEAVVGEVDGFGGECD